MFLSGLLSLKSISSSLALLIAVGIGAFLYLTLDNEFEAETRRQMLRTGSPDGLKSGATIEQFNEMINSARQAWSIIDQK
jgi:hypothetical protein